MSNGFFKAPIAKNEPVRDYAPGSEDIKNLLATYRQLYNEKVDIPAYIGGEEIRTGDTVSLHPPHDIKHDLGVAHQAEQEHIEKAVEVALEARKKWSAMPWQERAAIFLRAAELIAGPYRDKLNAATMIAQSKNVFQAEIDSACEIIDFLRFNVQFMTDIYKNQPESSPGI